MFACSGILYNHESPRRGLEFVTRKITSTAAKIKLGLANELRLGNLDARRDWGHAREYVKAMWMMLQQAHPDDYVIATGENHSVKDFAELAFSIAGLKLQDYLKVDDKYKRPAEVDNLLGNCDKATTALGWTYSLKFQDLVREMVESDIALFSRESRAVASGGTEA
jgi:GDPmannose 4,6-dehydratase